MSSQKHLLQFAKKYPRLIVFSIVLGFSGAIFNGVGTTLIVPAVFELLNSAASKSPDFPSLLTQLTEPFDSLPGNVRAAAMLGAILLAIVFKNLANYLSLITSEALTRSLTRDLRRSGANLLLQVDIDYHYKSRTGDIIQRLNDQIGRSVSSISTSITLVRVTINILFFTFVLIGISWPLTLTAVGLMSVVLLLNRSVIHRAKRFGKNLANASKEYSVRVLEMLNGMRLIKATANEQREYAIIESLIDAREHAAMQSQRNSAIIGPLNEILSILSLMGIIFISQFILRGNSTGSTTVLLTFLFVLSRLIPFVGQLNTARSRLANNTASVDVVYDFLRRDNKTFMVNGDIPYQPLQTGIHFENLSFGYPGCDNLVLKGVDLYLPKGKTLALVGASGAGKSTLADLLPRFYDPVMGRIALDSIDLRHFDIASVRKLMGIVSQDTFLFNASVRENIAYARPEAADDEVVEAAQRANAYEFITQLPQGFETPIGDRGVLLSGGQRQRLAIARALLQDPDILILDEATSALDTVSERLVQAALDELSRERTTLVIAHRLSTVRNADQIAVLHQGEVIEVGDHETLLRQNGQYASLYMVQFTQAIQEKTRQKQTLSKISHDMRTDLNAVLGALQLVVDNLLENEDEIRETIQEAYKAAVNLLPRLEAVEQGRKLPDTQLECEPNNTFEVNETLESVSDSDSTLPSSPFTHP